MGGSSSGNGGEIAMMVVWAVLIVLVIGGVGLFTLVRRRKARRP